MTRQPSWRGVRRVLLAGLLLAACSTSSTSSDSVLLTVSLSGSGTGSVDGQNITCPPDCLDRVDIGSSVSLLASAAQGSMFVEWSKDCSGTGIGTTFTADATPACDAKFDLIDAVTLTIAIDPAGNGTGRVVGPNINCGNGGIQCQATYTRNTSVDLEVEVDVGSTFAGWTGDCLTFGQSLNISLEMNLDKLCSVRYNEPASGALTPRGAFSFDYRIEAAGFRGTRVFTAAFDNPQGPGRWSTSTIPTRQHLPSVWISPPAAVPGG